MSPTCIAVNKVPPHLRKGPSAGTAKPVPGGDDISRHIRVSTQNV